jgi:YbbR domain-containing protein
LLEGLSASDIEVYIDTSNLSGGWQERKVRVKIPSALSLVEVLPATVSVMQGTGVNRRER